MPAAVRMPHPRSMTNSHHPQRHVAVVTGGTSGIGLATVHRLVSSGLAVMVGSRNAVERRGVIAGLADGDVAFRSVDVRDEGTVADLMQATIDRFGRLDHLVNNAGVEGTVGPIAAWSADIVDEVLAVNVKGALLCMKHAAPRMSSGSAIVNCSSLLATIPMPAAAPYAASKAALLSLTRSVAAELGARGISVLAICPGVVDTPMMERVSLAAGASKEDLAAMVCPSGQVTSPERVADVIAAMLANPASFPTGSAVRIDPQLLEPISA
jgi:NAD(P)-dependent dehydrogenase (short-subunit alcohol dehydrogenase family)